MSQGTSKQKQRMNEELDVKAAPEERPLWPPLETGSVQMPPQHMPAPSPQGGTNQPRLGI
ncbi:hypothetical protein NQ315_015691 [Exocentrus adspersus]|uniref:Prolactin receptor n=1 Tax=Exocentrus adspersus TaxID=1586481 RepID=A0AAV8W386_9CUCU|nr:hypothetical protein NQ315_015691 [Exocentrus adspersus]